MDKMNQETARWVVNWVTRHSNQSIPYPIARRIKAAYAVMGNDAPKFLQFASENRDALIDELNLDTIVVTAIRWYAAFKGKLFLCQEWAQACFDPEAAIELHRSGVTPAEAGVIVEDHNATIGYLVSSGDWTVEQAIEELNNRDKNRADKQLKMVQQNNQFVKFSGCLGFRLL